MELLTVQETTRMLKVHPITIRRYIADGQLPPVTVGNGGESVRKLPSNLSHRSRQERPNEFPEGSRPARMIRYGISLGRVARTVQRSRHRLVAH